MRLYLGADHGGFRLKEYIKDTLAARAYEVVDCGNHQVEDKDDYSLFSLLVAKRVAADQAAGVDALGLLFCRSSIGEVIAANKVTGIYAANAFDPAGAKLTREKNGANVLALAGDHLGDETAWEIIEAWLGEPVSEGDRHARRRAQITRYETGQLAVLPGVNTGDLFEAEQQLVAIAGAADWAHVDVEDGQLVTRSVLENPEVELTIPPGLHVDVHLMVAQPNDYAPNWIRLGAKRITAHVEAPGFTDWLTAKTGDAEYYAALDLPSPVAALESHLDSIDGILVMAVKIGPSGQGFDSAALSKIAALRELRPDLPISVDGGIDPATSAAVVAAGATTVVANSYLENNLEAGLAALHNL